MFANSLNCGGCIKFSTAWWYSHFYLLENDENAKHLSLFIYLIYFKCFHTHKA